MLNKIRTGIVAPGYANPLDVDEYNRTQISDKQRSKAAIRKALQAKRDELEDQKINDEYSLDNLSELD